MARLDAKWNDFSERGKTWDHFWQDFASSNPNQINGGASSTSASSAAATGAITRNGLASSVSASAGVTNGIASIKNTAEGGVLGQNPTIGNTGGTSGDPISGSAGAAQITFANDQAHRGSKSYKFVMPAATTTNYIFWSLATAQTAQQFGRVYLMLGNTPSASERIVQLVDSSGQQCASITYVAGVGIRPRNAANTNVGASSGIPPLNQWMRIEWRLIPSTTAGEIEVRIWWTLPDSPNLVDADYVSNATGAVLGADVMSVRIGAGSSVTHTSTDTEWFDDIAAWSSTWLGPSQFLGVASSISASSGSATGVALSGVVSGTASSVSASSGAATGSITRKGTLASVSTSSGAATGVATHHVFSGTATSTSASSGSATGRVIRKGVALSTSASSGTATGKITRKGVATSTSVSAGLATGVASSSASAHSTSTSSGVAAGQVIRHVFSGTASSTSTSSGTATGRRIYRGVATSTSTSTGNATGRASVRGVAISTSVSSGFAMGITSLPIPFVQEVVVTRDATRWSVGEPVAMRWTATGHANWDCEPRSNRWSGQGKRKWSRAEF